jgi:transcriptional regulator
MAKDERDQNRIELLQGTLDMLILQTLRLGPRHGYGIGQAIRAGSDDLLQVETGSLYPALHRLEKRGWIKAEWGTSENNQRAKYYQLTAAGRKQLATEHSRWNQMSAAIAGLMNPRKSEGEAS